MENSEIIGKIDVYMERDFKTKESGYGYEIQIKKSTHVGSMIEKFEDIKTKINNIIKEKGIKKYELCSKVDKIEKWELQKEKLQELKTYFEQDNSGLEVIIKK